MERTLQQGPRQIQQPRQDLTPEGLGMKDFGDDTTGGHPIMEDIMDRLQSDPTFKARLKDLLSR